MPTQKCEDINWLGNWKYSECSFYVSSGRNKMKTVLFSKYGEENQITSVAVRREAGFYRNSGSWVQRGSKIGDMG